MDKQTILYEHFHSGLSPIRIAIADDHKMIREFLVTSINAMNGFKVILAAENGYELLHGIKGLDQLPDICILDINMPLMNGYDTQLAVKNNWPEIKSLAISIFDDNLCITRMLQNGANGFISKQSPPEVIKEALLALVNEGFYYKQIPENLRNKRVTIPELTTKEKEYIMLICNEYSAEEIAQKMDINIRSLQYYRDAVYNKLNVNNKADLMFYVKRTGIVYMK